MLKIPEIKSIDHLLELYKTEKDRITLFENMKWGQRRFCPHCGSEESWVTKRGYRCKECKKDFTYRKESVLEFSKVPIKKWLLATYILTNSKRGISSRDLGRMIGVTKDTAHKMGLKIRELFQNKTPVFLDRNKVIEIDEAWFGGKEKNRHKKKRRKSPHSNLNRENKPYAFKKVAIAMIERNGMVVLREIESDTKEQMVPLIERYIPFGSNIITDEHPVYKLLTKYNRRAVTHSHGIYVVKGNKRKIHTNTVENFWSTAKRTFKGTYNTVSKKHFHRYLAEIEGRFNTRNMTNGERFFYFLSNINGRLLNKHLKQM